MINKFSRPILIIFCSSIMITSLTAQLPEPTQEFRGLWVTQFRTTVLGDPMAEDALIAYAVANDFNYLICTNIFQILTAPCGSFTTEMTELQAFISKAHTEGIEYVSGNVGSLTTAVKIQEYNECGSVSDIERLDMITYECEFYNAATNGSCPDYTSYISQLTDIKTICTSTMSSVPGRPLVCEAYIGGEGSTGLVITYSSEAEMEEIASVADHILLTYYRPMPSSSGGNFFNWTIQRLDWIANTSLPSNIVLLLKSRNTDGNNMNAYLASYPGTHYDAVRDPFFSWVEGMTYNPTLTNGYRENYNDGTYPWLSGIQVKGFTWFEHAANMALSPLPVSMMSFDIFKTDENHILLQWTTAHEVNNDHFEIQKSADGILWQIASKVNGYGNSTVIQNYTFRDEKPLNGRSYYRLKQVDHNGQAQFTETKSTYLEIISQKMRLASNLVSDQLIIFGNDKLSNPVQIFDVFGQMKFYHNVFDHENKGVINISDLPSGMYILSDGTESLKFIKR